MIANISSPIVRIHISVKDPHAFGVFVFLSFNHGKSNFLQPMEPLEIFQENALTVASFAGHGAVKIDRMMPIDQDIDSVAHQSKKAILAAIVSDTISDTFTGWFVAAGIINLLPLPQI